MHTKNEVSRSRLSKVGAQTGLTDTQIDRCNPTNALQAAFVGGNNGV